MVAGPDVAVEGSDLRPSLHLALRIAAFVGVPVELVFSLDPFPRIGRG